VIGGQGAVIQPTETKSSASSDSASRRRQLSGPLVCQAGIVLICSPTLAALKPLACLLDCIVSGDKSTFTSACDCKPDTSPRRHRVVSANSEGQGGPVLGLGQRGRPQRLSRVGAGSVSYQAQAPVLRRWLPRNGDSHDSQLDSSKRDLCNARGRTRWLCGERFLPRLLRRRLSLWNQRLLLWRVAGMARGIVCRSTGRPLNRGGKQAGPQFRGRCGAES
jgi:hypothetical protein